MDCDEKVTIEYYVSYDFCMQLFWFATFILAICGALFITNFQTTRYMKSPTVLTVDRNYRDWEGLMPAVTLCYYDRLDLFKSADYLLNYWNVSIADKDFIYLMNFLHAVINATASNYVDLVKFATDDRFDGVDLYDVVQTIKKNFEQDIKVFDPSFFVSVNLAVTERGLCYVINSMMTEVFNPRSSHQNPGDARSALKCKFSKNKCYIIIDLFENTGYVAIHSPFEITSTDASLIALQKSYEISTSFKVLETVASSNLRNLRVEQSKCIFNDGETIGVKIYSKTLCLAQCNADLAMRMCDCVPYFYKFADGPSCDPKGFRCLYGSNWPLTGSDFCKCPIPCTEVQYALQTVSESNWGSRYLGDRRNKPIVTSSFRLELIPPKVRLRRDVVFSFEDLLVSFGGTLSLFLGFSILTLISFIYVLAEGFSKHIYYLTKSIFKGCRHMKQVYLKRRKLKKETINIENGKMFYEVSFQNRIKQKRKKLSETHSISSGDKLFDVENIIIKK